MVNQQSSTRNQTQMKQNNYNDPHTNKKQSMYHQLTPDQSIVQTLHTNQSINKQPKKQTPARSTDTRHTKRANNSIY